MDNLPVPSDQLSSDKERRAREKAAQSAADKARAHKAALGRLGKYAGAVAVLGAVVVGLVWAAANGGSDYPVVSPSEITANDWKKGNPEAAVVLLEYADMQCPACAFYNNQVVARLQDEYGDRVLFVYRHFPLRTIHRNADNGARAAEAAGRQGKFWEMLNVLFANQTSWESLANPEETFLGYATSLGLDAEQFTVDYASDSVKDKVNADYKSAVAAGLTSTPSFFLNGQFIEEAGGYDGLKTHIENALAQTTQLPTENGE